MDDFAIRVESVSKSFKLPQEKHSSLKSAIINFGPNRQKIKNQLALQNITFGIKKGEFFGIVGRNGSGKSTLLKIIAGIYEPNKGHITLNGKLVPFIELGVGFNPELTGRENVYLNGALLGFSNSEINKQYKDIVEFAELEKFMDQKLKNYSSGMQVRLAFSMAIRAEADILLIDEVLAVGDADFQRKCFAYFKNLKKRHKTVIFVSHDMEAIREYCDRAVLINDSKIIYEGPASKVATEYLKLFNKQGQKDISEPGGTIRWGNGDIKYTNASCTPSVVNDEPTIKITCEAKASSDIDNVQLGFSIKNEADIWLFGTNNTLQKQKISIKTGEKIKIEWELPNILNTGKYFVNLTAEDKTLDVCDWWEEAAKFEVIRETFLGYIVSPQLKLKLDLPHKSGS